MPTISSFYGIVVMMFFNDHDPPHVHARYGEQRARIEIATAEAAQAGGTAPVRTPPILSVTALSAYVVRVVFADGEIREVDVEPLLGGPVFAPLRAAERFAQVFLDETTGAPTWPSGGDLDPDVIYGIAEPAGEPAARVWTPQPA